MSSIVHWKCLFTRTNWLLVQNLFAICDIAILITKDIGRKKMFSGDYPGVIPLPALFYKVPESTDGNEENAVKVISYTCSTGEITLLLLIYHWGQVHQLVYSFFLFSCVLSLHCSLRWDLRFLPLHLSLEEMFPLRTVYSISLLYLRMQTSTDSYSSWIHKWAEPWTFGIWVQADGSHLPPCFTDKDALKKRFGTSTRSGQVIYFPVVVMAVTFLDFMFANLTDSPQSVWSLSSRYSVTSSRTCLAENL